MTKKDCINKCKEIKNNYQLDFITKEYDVFKFLYNYFSQHSSWEQKKGVGIDYFYVDKAPNQNTTCFYIKRLDGSIVDISYNFTKPNKLKDIKMACRNSIQEIILNFRKKNFIKGMLCPLSGEIITDENLNVDHYNLDFIDIFDLWIKDKDIDLLYNDIKNNETEVSSDCFFSQKYKNDFIDFHNKNTHLRITSKNGNQGRRKL